MVHGDSRCILVSVFHTAFQDSRLVAFSSMRLWPSWLLNDGLVLIIPFHSVRWSPHTMASTCSSARCSGPSLFKCPAAASRPKCKCGGAPQVRKRNTTCTIVSKRSQPSQVVVSLLGADNRPQTFINQSLQVKWCRQSLSSHWPTRSR